MTIYKWKGDPNLKRTEYTVSCGSLHKANIKESTEWPPGFRWLDREIFTSGLPPPKTTHTEKKKKKEIYEMSIHRNYTKQQYERI